MQTVKMVISGAVNAGKTEFIKAISEIEVVSTERRATDDTKMIKKETTVAMDFGRITISDDVVLYLFGTPGQERFSFMWETLSEGMLGFVLLVDVVDGDTFSDAKTMIDFFREMSDVPFVVAANKVAAEDTDTIRQLRGSLCLEDSVPLLPVDAREKESVKAVLLGLLYEILESMD